MVAELAEALTEAQKAGLELGDSNSEALELYARLEAARAEVQALQRAG